MFVALQHKDEPRQAGADLQHPGIDFLLDVFRFIVRQRGAAGIVQLMKDRVFRTVESR